MEERLVTNVFIYKQLLKYVLVNRKKTFSP